MNKMPDRIWATPFDSDMDGGTYCDAAERPTSPNHDAWCYIRADLARALPAVQLDPRIKEYEDAYQYALHLAEALRENYPPNPDFRFLGDLVGLLTQIDNMVAGLPQPYAREAALREALAAVNAKWRSGAASTPDEMRGLALAEAAILALLDKPAMPNVNETPKSEHDAVNMLTLTAERDRLAAAVDAVMADRKRILEERDRGFVMVMERAERAEAEVARLAALLPHPGETAAEVMWRNFQRGVRLEELAKTAGVTRERARQMVRKAEARGIRYE